MNEYGANHLIRHAEQENLEHIKSEFMVDALKRSIIIKLGDLESACEMGSKGKTIVPPPFDCCLFEVEEEETDRLLPTSVCLVQRDENIIRMNMYTAIKKQTNNSAQWGIVNATLLVEINDLHGEITYKIETKAGQVKNEAAESAFVERCVLVARCFEVIACSNVELQKNTQYKKCAKKTRKKNKKKEYDFWTLHINTNRSGSAGTSHCGHHQSPRLHLRRGHIRRLQTGLKIWVNSCMVGTQDNGIIEKDYEIK